ncbi:MAG: UDP-galactopyranose mutase [Marinilabiliaceae bacterium]|nr:UDP-galactopyranose mutase [Marinilabiliaceae bacterium]
MDKKYDILVVGSGLFGAVFAAEAHKKGLKVLVIDKRKHCGGNVYCENIDGINVHKYGAHIFHTSDVEVWRYVNNIVEMNRYTNQPVANYKGKLYNLPFNMNTFYQMWGVTTPAEAKAKIEEQRQAVLKRMRAANVVEPRNLEEQARMLIGDDIFEILIKGYTEKQWGRSCEELPAFIIKRLPVRFTFDNNYFNDNYQGIPIGGYNRLIDGLLNGIEVRVDTDYFQNREMFDNIANTNVFTGQIDEFFDYKLGHLHYRTVRFEQEQFNTSNYQGNAVVNYTAADVPYTRIIEHKHFEFGSQQTTIISREYSTEWRDGMEPYYPINDERNNKLAEQYRELGAKTDNVIFGGRLAEYKYFDMDKVVRSALDAFRKFKKN